MKNYVTTNLILDDQGGQQISVRTDGKSPTLRAEMHGNQPCVLTVVGVDMYNQSITGDVAKTLNSIKSDSDHTPCVVTFEPGIASRDGGHVYENVSGTIRATPGDNQMTVVLENHPNDSRVKIDDSGTVQTLTSRCGTGGGNVPMVLEPVCFQQNQREEVRIMDVLGAIMAESGMHNTNYVVFSKIRRAKTADDFETWGETGVCNTLNTFDNGDVRTNECVICLQGNGIDRADTAGCNGKGWTEDVSFTLNTIDRHAVAFGVTTKGNGDAFISEERHTALTNGGGQAGQGYPCVMTAVGVDCYNIETTGEVAKTHTAGRNDKNNIPQDAYNDMFVVEKRGGGRTYSRCALCNRLQVSATTADRTGEGGDRDE